jgi:hypothetical protein
MKLTIGKVLLVLSLSYMVYMIADIFISAQNIRKYATPQAFEKVQEPEIFNFLFRPEVLKGVRFRKTNYNDRKKILSTYSIDSLNKEILIVELDDAKSLLPAHIFIHRNADLLGTYRQLNFSKYSADYSFKPFNLTHDFSVRYDGSPVSFEVLKRNCYYFRSKGLQKLSIHFNKYSQAAYTLENKEFLGRYQTEFALLKTDKGNFLVFLLSKGKDKSSDHLLPKILKV